MVAGLIVGVVGGSQWGYDKGWDKRGEICKETIQSRQDTFGKAQEYLNKTNYREGVIDALQTISLLNLELYLNGDRKNFGDMGEIVKKRLKVEKEVKWQKE